MNNDRKILVMVADDHPVVREGLCSMVNGQNDMQVIAEAATGREAIFKFLWHNPDVALIDLQMPELDGIEVIKAIRAQVPAARLIVLTTFSSDEDVFQSLQAGATAFLLKDNPKETLLNCIRSVAHDGKTWMSSEVAAHLTARLKAPQLSQRELEVLREIAVGKSNKEVGAALFITEGTVKMHINHLLKKLGVESRTEAITQGIKIGIVQVK